MTPEHWVRVQAQFAEALAQHPETRAAWLAALRNRDAVVGGEVSALLEAHESAGDFLERPVDVDPQDVIDVLGHEPPAGGDERLATGTRVGDYEIREEIGRGGMGIVYLAHDLHLSRPVALKSLSGMTSDEVALQRFRREARAAAAVAHPGVATVYAFIETPHGHFIASEFVAGRTLREELAIGPIEPGRVVRIAREIVHALAAAHDAQVVHRDLKPENILVTSGGTVKVIDFGIARIDRASGSVLTMPGTLQGTLGYMAPEQLVSGAVADARADIYAVGVVVAEMLLGAHPMEGRVALPAWIDPIVGRCLESDRERRYQSARDLLVDLEQAAAKLDVATAGPRSADGGARHAARWWWQAHQALAAVVYWAMVVPAWHGGVSVGGGTGRMLFFLTLTGMLLASLLRLHLWFVMRTSPHEFIRQRRHETRWIRVADALFAIPLLIMGGLIADAQIALAVFLVAVGIGSGVVAAFIEPATTRAAFPD